MIGLLTTLPGLSTKSLTYDEALEARLAQLPIVSQYASYADATARQMDWSSGLVLDSWLYLYAGRVIFHSLEIEGRDRAADQG